MSEADDRYHVCVTCGRLKHERLFEDGDCTCQDCYNEGRSEVNWHEAEDGDGFVAADGESSPSSTETDRSGGQP